MHKRKTMLFNIYWLIVYCNYMHMTYDIDIIQPIIKRTEKIIIFDFQYLNKSVHFQVLES